MPFDTTDLEVSAPAAAASPAESLAEDGYCIIHDAIDPGVIEALQADLGPSFDAMPFSVGEFYGSRTKRFGSVLKRSRHAEALVCHPLVLEAAQAVLGPWCDTILLNLTQGIEIHPGELIQAPHRDQDMWRVGGGGKVECLLNVMWPFTDYTAENGATIIWPGSHHSPKDYLPDFSKAVAAEMRPGAALMFLGSTLHGGGANHTALPRTGLIISYCLGWLRTFENQFLAYPPEVARGFSPELARLIGYEQHKPGLGNHEGRCPSELLRADDDTGGEATPRPFADALPAWQSQAVTDFKRLWAPHIRIGARA